MILLSNYSYLLIYFDSPFLACLVQLISVYLEICEDCTYQCCIIYMKNVQCHFFTPVQDSIYSSYILHYKVEGLLQWDGNWIHPWQTLTWIQFFKLHSIVTVHSIPSCSSLIILIMCGLTCIALYILHRTFL